MTDALTERIKELECLYRISALLTVKLKTLKETLPEILEIIIPAWQYPEITCARIVVRSYDFKSSGYENTRWKLKESITIDGEETGFIEVLYRAVPFSGFGSSPPLFLDEERKLLKSIAHLVAAIITRKDAETNMRKTLNELRSRTLELERTNIALREVLTHFEREKRSLLEQISSGIRQNISPILHALRHFTLSPEQRDEYLDLLAKNLDHAIAERKGTPHPSAEPLTPREIEVANLIREGFQNKEIARLLSISVLTVERHRHNIRKKIGIEGQRVNLSSILRQK